MAEVAKTQTEAPEKAKPEPVQPEKKTTPPSPGSSAHAELLRQAK